MRLEIERSQSTAFAVVLLVIGVLFAVAIPALLLVAVLGGDAGALGAAALAALFAFLFVPAGVAAWRLARSHPSVVVTVEGITIEDRGLFVRPVHLPRSEVHSVYVRPFHGPERPPHFYGRDWILQLRRWNQSQPTLPVSSLHCPDLSLHPPFESPNLLIVVAHSMPMEAFARRGLGSLAVVLARGAGFDGPTRATVARGFFASVAPDDHARHAFASYPTAAVPDPDLWDWLYAGTNRGFGWLGWRSRRSQETT